ncbi:Acrosomal protein [Galemys pyrenaicus]|uniref:Acrosomal protein n=1 Tax=Galemys pyrenaicus TaxID=202257 RepID=A0A8J5ZWE7_GALPY|nr:Acrosomal protein [Galemys pyrenaicus]
MFGMRNGNKKVAERRDTHMGKSRYGEEKSNNGDPIMANPPSDVSGYVDVLETNDEGKKKSKFKALRNFFGKKKKKEAEDVQAGSILKPALPSSIINVGSLKPLPESQPIEPQVKRPLRSKALSHDSIFLLKPEGEKSEIQLYSSPEPHRGRTMQPTNANDFFLSQPWQIPPLRSCQPSISPPLIRSDTITKDLEEIAEGNESPKTLQRRTSPQKLLTLKSTPEPVSRQLPLDTIAMFDSPSSPLPSVGFSTPAGAQGYLTTSAPQHQMTSDSWRQKNPQSTVKTKQEEPSLLVSEEEKSTAMPKEPEQRKLNKDSAGSSNLEQSNKSKIWDKKTVDQAGNTDAAAGLGYPLSVPFGRKHGRKGSSPSETIESGSRGRNVKLPSRRLGLGDRAGSLPADKTASDIPLWLESLEKLNMEQLTVSQAETATPRELLSEDDVRRRNAGTDTEARKASAAQPVSEDVAGSPVSGPRLNQKDEASGTKKIGSRASYFPVVESQSTTQEDVFSVPVEAQVFMDPSHFQSEKEDTSSFDSHNVRFEMESAEDIPTTCKEKPPGNVLQTLTAGISGAASAVTEGGFAAEGLLLRSRSHSLGSLKAEVSDSDSTSDTGNDSDQPLTSECSLESFEMPYNEQEVSIESKRLAVKAGNPKQQLVPKYSSQSAGTRQVDSIISSESGSARIDSDQQLTLGKPKDNQEVITESEVSFVQSSSSEKQASGKSENKGSTKSKSCVERYKGTDDWSISEGDLLFSPPSHTMRNPKRQQVVPSVLKNIPEEYSVPTQALPPRHPSEPSVRMNAEQHVSSGAVSVSTRWNVPVRPPKHLFQPWLKPRVEREAPADPERAAVDWDISVEPLPPRILSKRLMRPKFGQGVYSDSKGPEVPTPEGITSAELLSPKHSSQPPMKPIAERKISAGPESTAVGGSISVEKLLPSCPSQPSVKPVIVQQVLKADCAVVEKRISMAPLFPRQTSQPLTKSLAQQQVSVGPECAAAGESISMEPLPPRHSFQPRVNPKFGQKPPLPERTAVQRSVSVEPLPPEVLAPSLMNPGGQKVFLGLEADRVITAQPPRPQYSPKSLKAAQAQHVFSEDIAIGGRTFVGLPPPTGPLESLVKPTVPPRIRNPNPARASAEWCSPVESEPSKDIFQPWVSPKSDSQVSAQSAAMEWGISLKPLPPRMHCQRLMRSVAEQEGSSGSASASAEWGTAEKPLPPRGTFRTQMNPKFEQQVSAGAENTGIEKSVSVEHLSSRMPSRSLMKPAAKQPTSSGPESGTVERGEAAEPLPPRHSWSSMRHKIYQASPGFQSADTEGISRASVTPKYPTQSFMKPRIQQISSHLENIAAGGTPKQLVTPRPPSQSYVKFMAQQIFSESQANEGVVCVDALASNQPSKSGWRPKVEPQVFSSWESATMEEGTSPKRLPTHPSQSFGKPEDPRQVFSRSRSALLKWTTSEEHLPSRQPFQAEEGAELQSQVFSTGLAKSSVECSPLQPSANPSYQKSIHSSSMSATPEGKILESNPSSSSLSKGPASPNKAKGHSSEDLTKNTLTPFTKPEKFGSTPDLQAFPSRDTYSKEGVLKSRDRSNNRPKLPVRGTSVESLFGVRLKKVHYLQRYKSERQLDFTKYSSISSDPTLSSIGRGQRMRRSSSQGFLGTSENLTTTPEFVEKLRRRPISERMFLKPSVYRIPGEEVPRKPDYASPEPSWIAMVKQKSFLAHMPMSESKRKSRSGAFAETKEHGYEGAGLAYTQPKKIFTSNINQQEKMALMKSPVPTKAGENIPVSTKAGENTPVPTKAGENTRMSTKAGEKTRMSTKAGEKTRMSTKAGEKTRTSTKADENTLPAGCEDETTFRGPAMGKETGQSSTFPALPQEQVEPVWFSMAKKKSKAWSQIAETMQ